MRLPKTSLSLSLIQALLGTMVPMVLLAQFVDAKSGLIGSSDAAAMAFEGIDIDDLNSMLMGRNDLDLGFEKAKAIIRRLDDSPICAHLATKRLLVSCKSIKDPVLDSESARFLDNAKTIYAIRHAICQLRSAKSPVPEKCLGIERVTDLSDTQMELLPAKNIEGCLSFLSQSHFWTSYSNSLQDASALCDPARIDYKREELLSIYRELTNILPGFVESIETQKLAMSHFVHSLEQDAERLLQSFDNELKVLSQTQSQLVSELVAHLGQVYGSIEEVRQISTDEMVAVNKALTALEQRTAQIDHSLNSTQSHAFDTISVHMESYQDVVNNGLEMLAKVLMPIQSLYETGLVQQLQESVKQSEYAIDRFSTIVTQQTDALLMQNALIVNTTDLTKTNYDQVLAMNKALTNLQNVFLPWAKSVKHLLARTSSLCGQALVFIMFLLFVVAFPRSKIVGICCSFALAYTLLQCLQGLLLQLHQFWKARANLRFKAKGSGASESYEFMLAAAVQVLIISYLLLTWMRKRRSRVHTQILPIASSANVIQGLDRVRLSKNQQATLTAATVGPHI